MANGLGGAVLPQIQRIFHGGTLAGLTDGQLLERFAARSDEAAFEALLARHGPLVLTVCRNLLHDRDDVEDAFQATLLILVRKAGSIQLETSLGPWIYSVAYRVAIRARANRGLRARRENAVPVLDPQAPLRDLDGHDISPLLHDELARLPERLRAPLVLCYFQGLTHEMAAEQLRWPVGTVRSRMARARRLLRDRLTRKGIGLSAGFLIGTSRQATAATIPRVLTEETIQTAMRIAAGRAALSGALSVPVTALMEGVLSTMWLTKLKAAIALAIMAGFIMTGVVALAVQAPDDKPDETVPAKRPQTSPADSNTRNSMSETYPRTYYVGDIIGTKDHKNANMVPVIDLITSTVASGTWKINDAIADDQSTRYKTIESQAQITPKIPEQITPIGSITPFPLSISIIVRHTPQVHEEVAARLLQLRHLVHQRNAYTVMPNSTAKKMVMPPPSDPPAASPIKGGERARKLIEELEQEIEDLVRERDRLRPDPKAGKTSAQDTVQQLEDLARAESFSQWIGLVY
ncbi:RNA polymerase sigma factor [Singulisphaera sp. Ch08]|uniref:RNA polymerase sigma factor n=1 Tax=Singulisphaera sp. Ch08 TaxID=3120278 RepID=A0AAU7CB02_9BACT